MKLYLAEQWYNYEGLSTIGIFSAAELAEVHLLAMGYVKDDDRYKPAVRYALGLGDGASITEITLDKPIILPEEV